MSFVIIKMSNWILNWYEGKFISVVDDKIYLAAAAEDTFDSDRYN